MLIFLYGTDTFRSRESLHKMIRKFTAERDPSGYNVVRLDALTEKPTTILTELHGSPFLAEKRMVVIQYALESKHAVLHEKLETILEDEHSIPSTTICVVYEKNDTFKTKIQKELLKKLASTAYAQHFETLEGAQLARWIAEYAKEKKLVLEKRALDFITTHSRGNSWFIHSLVDQLAAYCNATTCTIETVQLFLNESADDNIFNLIDAIVAKKPQKIYAMIREQYDRGEDAQYIFSMLIRQFRIMLQIKDALVRTQNPALRPSPDILAKTIGIHPFVVKKTIPLLATYTLEQLKTLYNELLSIDIKTKTGKGSMPTLIDLLVGKICVK